MPFKKTLKSYSKRDRTLSFIFASILGATLLFGGIKGLAKLIFGNKVLDGSYTEGVVGDLSMINPLFTDFSSANRDISSLIYSGLTKYNPETKTFEEDLATIKISEDGLKYAFELRDEVLWHDGEPLNIDDVYFTYQTVIKSDLFKNEVLKESLRGVEIQIIADDEIEFTLPKANSFFISNTNIGILPKHIWQTIPIETMGTEINEEELVGTGPYKFDSIETLNNGIKQVNLSKNKKYYASNDLISSIKFFIFPTEEQLLEAQNTLNSIPDLSFEYKSQLDADRFDTQEYILPQYTALFLNTENNILSSVAVRKALQQGSNKKILQELLSSKQIIGKPYYQFENITEIGEPDTQLIKEDLYAAGWALNDDGYRQKDDQLLELDLTVPVFQTNPKRSQEYQLVADHLIKQYKQLGIKVNLNLVESESFGAILNSKSYDMVLYGHSLGQDLDSYSFWHSSQGGQNGFNLSNYKSTAVDSLLDQLRDNTDTEVRNSILVQINAKLTEDSPAIFLYTEKHLFAFDKKIQNRKILEHYAFPSDRFYNVENWELSN